MKQFGFSAISTQQGSCVLKKDHRSDFGDSAGTGLAGARQYQMTATTRLKFSGEPTAFALTH